MASLVETDQDLQAGESVGEYQLEHLLGRGGFGVVYAATHPVIGKKAAIKVLHRKFSADPDIVSRFVSEARAVNQIRHQHIIDIFAFGRLPDGRQYYVMELLDGAPLDHLLRERKRLPPREALAVLRPIARALDAAHAAGIAHRDLKAENIFVAEDSEGEPFPKLLDFGIAKLLGPDAVPAHRTATGAPIGTPLYMSPEQAAGKGVDHRTDIYSFGVLCYQVLTGELPFTGGGYMEILTKQVHDTATPPSQVWKELPTSVDDEIAAMMAKDPADRPASLTIATSGLATALGISGAFDAGASGRPSGRAALVRAVDPLAETHATPGFATGERMAEPSRSRAPWIAGGLVVAAAGLAAIWFATRRSDDATPAPVAMVSVDAAPRAVPPPDATPAAPDATPAAETVTIRLRGAARGARVTDAAGKVVGTTPGALTLPRGDAPIELHVELSGFMPETVEVTPTHDHDVTVLMQKKRPPKKPPKGSNTGSSISDEIGDL